MTLELAEQDRLSPRNAAGELRRRVLDYLRSTRPAPGSRLATEAELVRSLKVSRSTVRRALDPLERAGWIDRRAGAGTFVGRRVGELVALGQQAAADADAGRETTEQLRVRHGRGIVRVAVLIFNIGDLAHDWYTPAILEGLDSAGDEHRVVVELLGDRDGDTDAISRRLELSRPDVLICLSSRPQHAFILRDAQRLGIHCLVSGTPHLGLGIPAVCEDNRQAMRLAVEQLHQCGHRRIALAIQSQNEPWALERHEAFIDAMAAMGHSSPEQLVHWLPLNDPRSGRDESMESLWRFIDRTGPTAVLAGSYMPMLYLDRLQRVGRIRIPEQLSVVSFEQNLAASQWLGGMDIAYVRFPFQQMGGLLAAHARALVNGQSVPSVSHLAAEWISGRSVEPVLVPSHFLIAGGES